MKDLSEQNRTTHEDELQKKRENILPLYPLPREGDTYEVSYKYVESPTAVPLKLCPFCGNIPYKHFECNEGWRRDGKLLVSCENANCPASCIHTSPETWNERPLDEAVDSAYKKLQNAHKNDLKLINTMYDALKYLKNICGDEIGVLLDFKFAKIVDKAIEEAESL